MRVAIAEDGVLLREGLSRLLGEAGFDVVAQCGDADELMLKVRSYPLDVAIVDIRLPPTHSDEGLRAALEIRASHPSVGVLVLSQYVELGLAMKLLADSAEGVGYLLKDTQAPELCQAIKAAAAGQVQLTPRAASRLMQAFNASSSTGAQSLTERETEVLRLLAQGQTNRQIAHMLNITEKTTKTHVSNILSKLGVQSRTQATLYAIRVGLISAASISK